MSNKFLIVVDMQNDFITGPLGSKQAQEIIPNVVKKIEDCQNNDYFIIFTQDTHDSNYLNTNEGKHLPIKHCIENTNGWKIADKLLKPPYFNIIKKNQFGFESWEEYLKFNLGLHKSDPIEKSEISEFQIIGLVTDICVISNAIILKSLFPEAKIIVDSSCCAGTSKEAHENALKAMKQCQIEII